MLAANKVLVITDNAALYKEFIQIVKSKPELSNTSFTYCCSPSNVQLMDQYGINSILVRQNYQNIINNYDLIISAHCKQIFPTELINKIRCINIHPGLNPFNRGWFPQVFSIINKLPLGATIHEIDAELDHGPIIAQQAVPLYSYDTSLTAYNRVQKMEVTLLEKHIVSIINGDYAAKIPHAEGNVNLKKDFNSLLEINLHEQLTMGDAIDRLRALSHGNYKNAFFLDDNNDRIYISITLSKEDK
ncbi:dTDP-4-amino-4,6-dideoxyglucose formyltransferase [Hymenobacter seoulensis]